jgi:WD40 repeat protein
MSGVTLSDNGDLAATIENGIVIRNYSDLSVYSKIDTWSGISIGFNSDASMITSGYISAQTFNTMTSSQILSINVDSSFVQRLWFIDSDKELFGVLQPLSGSGSYGSAIIWDAKTGTIVRRIDSILDIYPSAITMSRDRKTILLGVQNQTIKFTVDTSLVSSILDKGTTFYSLALTDNGEHFIGTQSEQISYYATSSGTKIKTIDNNLYEDPVYLAISPDDSLLLSATYFDYQVNIYDIAAGSLIRIIDAFDYSGGYVSGLQFSGDGQSFVVTSANGMMKKYARSELLYSWQRMN